MPKLLWLPFVTLLLLPRLASATIVVAMPEDELIRASDAIVLGNVIAVEAVLNDNGHIVTRAQVQVMKGLRGAKANAILTVEVPGGRLPNGLSAYVDGAPKLEVGQLVFGFMERHGTRLRPLGLRYGLLRVHSDGKGGYLVSRNTDGLVLVDRLGRKQRPEVVSVEAVPLESMIARIEKRMRALGITPESAGVAQ